jgi:hypothetical protein
MSWWSLFVWVPLGSHSMQKLAAITRLTVQWGETITLSCICKYMKHSLRCWIHCWSQSSLTADINQLLKNFITLLWDTNYNFSCVVLTVNHIKIQLSQFWTLPILYLKHTISETGYNMFQIKDRMMDNVQNCDSYINIPSSQTYRSYIKISAKVGTNFNKQQSIGRYSLLVDSEHGVYLFFLYGMQNWVHQTVYKLEAYVYLIGLYSSHPYFLFQVLGISLLIRGAYLSLCLHFIILTVFK